MGGEEYSGANSLPRIRRAAFGGRTFFILFSYVSDNFVSDSFVSDNFVSDNFVSDNFVSVFTVCLTFLRRRQRRALFSSSYEQLRPSFLRIHHHALFYPMRLVLRRDGDYQKG